MFIIHLKSVQYCLNFTRNYIKGANKQFYKMSTAYFRHETEQNQFQITFRLLNDQFKIDRTFNFSRYITENITTCMDRIKTNVEKEFVKKTKKKKSKVAEKNSFESTAPNVTVELLKDGRVLEDGCFNEILVPNVENNLVLRIINEEFRVIFNSPWVTQIVLPTSILAGFIVYPSKLELQFSDKALCTIKWFRGAVTKSKNDDDIEWTEVGEGFRYTATTEDIEHKLKLQCTPRNEFSEGPVSEYISKCLVQAGPGICPFQTRHLFTEENACGDKFRVMSYNILADLYADSDFARTNLFNYCPIYALTIDYRKQLYIKEIIGYNADIICLQEVDSKIFDLDLQIIFETYALKGCYKPKGTSAEGLATFYNTNRFAFIKHSGMNLGENVKMFPPFAKLFSKIKSNEKLVSRLADRATAVQATVLRSKERPDEIVVVANTHLYFHPDADHIRLLQIGFSMLFIENVIEELKQEINIPAENISLIFCGDFNSTPECGIFKLMTTNNVPDDMIDWRSSKYLKKNFK